MRQLNVFLVLVALCSICLAGLPLSLRAEEPARVISFNPNQGCKEDVPRSKYEEAYCRKFEFIQDLKKDEDWYFWQKNALNYLWIVGSTTVLVLTALTAFLIAVGFADGGRNKILLASLPAMATLISTLMAQFQVRELWELREMGRIRMQEIISSAKLLTADDDAKMRDMIFLIEKDRILLSRSQASQFFTNIRSTNKTIDEPPAALPAPAIAPALAPR